LSEPVKGDTELAKLNMMFDRGLDIDGRTIYIFGEINDGLAEDVIMSLNHLSLTTGDITVMINSQGGSVADMFAIYDAILACPNEVTTVGIGEVCSAAALLLVSGDKRLASRNCLFMAHQVVGGYDVDEKLDTVKAQIAATEMCWKRWAKCMEKHTKPTAEWWGRDMPAKLNELWLPVEKMVMKKYRIIDGIWE
jgi:ATP-dependent protease ClpP protease subunit